MEKILRYLIAAVVAFVPAVVSLSSCSDKEDENNISSAVVKEKIIGVWKSESNSGAQTRITAFIRVGEFKQLSDYSDRFNNFDYFEATETSAGYEYLDLTVWAGVQTYWEYGSVAKGTGFEGVIDPTCYDIKSMIDIDFAVTKINKKEFTANVSSKVSAGTSDPVKLYGSRTFTKSSEKEMQEYRQKVISSGTSVLKKKE